MGECMKRLSSRKRKGGEEWRKNEEG